MPGLFRGDAADTAHEVAGAEGLDVMTDAGLFLEDIEDMTKAQMVDAIIAAGKQDQESVVALIEALLEADLEVPMGVDADGETAMGAIMTEVEGVVYVAVFTSREAAEHVREMAPDFATMTGKRVIETLRPDMGLVVETGAGRFGLIPPMLASIRETIEARVASGKLEQLANRVRSGAADIHQLIEALMEAKLVVPTPDKPGGDRGFTPLIVMVNDSPRLVVAASFDAATRSRGVAEFAMSVEGKFLFALLKDGVGLQLNTVAGSVDFPPELCASVVKKYALDVKS